MKLILFLVISFIGSSVACQCYCPEGWQREAYCNSKFVGIIKVQNSTKECEKFELCHSIIVVEQLRGHKTTPTVLKTMSSFAACGVMITEGEMYFVATDPIDGDVIGLNSCQLYENWNDLSDVEFVKRKNEVELLYKCDDDSTPDKEHTP